MITGQKIFSLLKALAVSYIITAILLLITAFLMYKLGLGDTVIHLSIIIIHGISVFLGGFLTGKMVKEQKYIWGLMLGVCYVLVIGIKACCVIISLYDIKRRSVPMKRIKTLTNRTMKNTMVKGGCGECQTSCQSACKTSCTVGNQSCENAENK